MLTVRVYVGNGRHNRRREQQMTSTIPTERDDTAAIRECHAFLSQLYDEAYEEWTRQDAVVKAMHASGSEAPEHTADEQDALATALRRQLDDLAIAVERSQLGTYGVCETCGETIPAERLRRYPAARHCLDCKERLDLAPLIPR
jgi:RNA polymerase-binding transcription factor DksA